MTPAGAARIAAAIANGQWTFLDDVERLEIPPDLAAALESGGGAVWDAYPGSVKRGCLEWIKTAKTAPACSSRIAEVAKDAASALRPRLFRR